MIKALIATAILAALVAQVDAKPRMIRPGELFTNARAKLYTAGWKADPAAHVAAGEYAGLDRQLIEAGYEEVDYCSVGKAFCVLQYTRGTACLRLHIAGEEIRSMKVERWSDECRERGASEEEDPLPADVRYIGQWRDECESSAQCKDAAAFLQRLKKKYVRDPSIMQILESY